MVLLLMAGLLVGHLLLLMLASIPPHSIQAPPQERRLRISLSPMAMPMPVPDEDAAKKTAASPAEEPEGAPDAVPVVPPARAMEKPEQPVQPPPPVEAAKPEPEPEPESKPERPVRPDEPNLEPLTRSRTAFDTARGQEKPPENAVYEGDTNTEAADRSDKKKIGPDPKIDGESGEIRSEGRRGETENKEAKREDPTAGAIEREGNPDPGTPVEPQEQVAQRPEPEPAVVPQPVAEPKAVEPEETPPTEVAKPIEEPKVGAVVEDEPDGVDPLKQRTPIEEEARRLEREREAVAKRPPEKAEIREQVQRPAPAPEEQDVAVHSKHTPKGPVDPELARLRRLLNNPQAAPENAHQHTGAGTRKGQIGHEGDGRVREGELNAVSDVVSATMTSAAKEGEVAFSKRATPENAYLKPFFRRMDAKWKAVFFSDNRALSRMEYGEVRIRLTFDKRGQLIESVEDTRRNGISDRAVNACLEGARRAAPHDAFPPALAHREKLTTTVLFLYR